MVATQGSQEASRDHQLSDPRSRFSALRSELAARIPRVEPGSVIRLQTPNAPVRFLWPTSRCDYPFVGVVHGSNGYRYPFYFEADDAARLLRDEYCIVDERTVPVTPPPDAVTAKDPSHSTP